VIKVPEYKQEPNVDPTIKEKEDKKENIKKIVLDVIDRGLLDLRRGGLLAFLLAANDQDGKCGCRDVCSCHSGCLC
jgi:hypothetical protein